MGLNVYDVIKRPIITVVSMLALVIFGAVLLVIESNRRDRLMLERRLEEPSAEGGAGFVL